MKLLRHLEPAATAELDERVRDYPGYVERGLVPAEDAAADVAAWRAIVRWCAGEEPSEPIEIAPATLLRWDSGRAELAQRKAPLPPPPCAWEVMELAADKALRHLERLRAASPDDEAIATRRARVDAILSGIQRDRLHHVEIDRSRRLRAWRAAVKRFGDPSDQSSDAIAGWIATGAAQWPSLDTVWTDLAGGARRVANAVEAAAAAQPADGSLARMRKEVAAVLSVLANNSATFERRAA